MAMNFPVSTPIARPHYMQRLAITSDSPANHALVLCPEVEVVVFLGSSGRATRAHVLSLARTHSSGPVSIGRPIGPIPGDIHRSFSIRLRSERTHPLSPRTACVRRAAATSVFDLRLLASRLIAEADHVHPSKYSVRYRCVLRVARHS